MPSLLVRMLEVGESGDVIGYCERLPVLQFLDLIAPFWPVDRGALGVRFDASSGVYPARTHLPQTLSLWYLPSF